jgi:hypothetical protein
MGCSSSSVFRLSMWPGMKFLRTNGSGLSLMPNPSKGLQYIVISPLSKAGIGIQMQRWCHDLATSHSTRERVRTRC